MGPSNRIRMSLVNQNYVSRECRGGASGLWKPDNNVLAISMFCLFLSPIALRMYMHNYMRKLT